MCAQSPFGPNHCITFCYLLVVNDGVSHQAFACTASALAVFAGFAAVAWGQMPNRCNWNCYSYQSPLPCVCNVRKCQSCFMTVCCTDYLYILAWFQYLDIGIFMPEDCEDCSDDADGRLPKDGAAAKLCVKVCCAGAMVTTGFPSTIHTTCASSWSVTG